MFAFPPTAQYGEIKRPAPKHQGWYVGDKAKALPIVNQNWGPLSHEPENQLLERGSLNLPDAMLGCLDPRHHRPLGCYPQTVLVSFSAENERASTAERRCTDRRPGVVVVELC